MIPDTMKLLGVYDTSANMQVFYSRSEYQKYLEQQSGASGSGFGFYSGVKNAWGSSTTEGKQKYLAVFDIDVDRYERFGKRFRQSLSSSQVTHPFGAYLKFPSHATWNIFTLFITGLSLVFNSPVTSYATGKA